MTSVDPERRLDRYVPRVQLRHLAQTPAARLMSVDATLVFADISGFTALSERLARLGREGAEELTHIIGGSLSTLLTVAYDNGGSLLKLGGDALLLLFEDAGHAARGCRAAAGMRATLGEIGRVRTDAGAVTLRISQGVHSGTFHLFLVGDSHREQMVVGADASAVVRMEKAADAGEILISPQTAALLDPACSGARKGPGLLLAETPKPTPWVEPAFDRPSREAVAACLPTMVRAHVTGGEHPSEHRNVTVAFIQFTETDELIAEEGLEAAADALEELVSDVQRAVDHYEVCFLESDVDDGGGKLLLTAGAPRVIGDDEERMLLAMRRVLEGGRRLPVRIGVNRGNVFAGEIGPPYRSTYSVMGDAVNLAARVMSKAPPGELYCTAGALERSPTRFRTLRLEPFAAKGKAELVQAWSVGAPVSARSRAAMAIEFPLIGRTEEIATLMTALDAARAGDGRLVEIVGEAGIGKSRLSAELRTRADDAEHLSATAEAFTLSTPYSAWRELLRTALGVGWEDTDEVVLTRLEATVRSRAPELLPWVPLLAVPFDVDAPSTPEVDALAPAFRRARLHGTVIAFLRVLLDGPTVLVCDDAQYLDEASAELFADIAREVTTTPWMVLLVGREGGTFTAPDAPGQVRLEPPALSPEATRRLAGLATDSAPLNPAVLDIAIDRSAGNPQFLRDLLRAAAEGGHDEDLPESLEAAAMARIDRLDPVDRTIIRRASVLGLSFHPRFLIEMLGDDVPPPDAATWQRLEPFFQDDGDDYLRFRRAIIRDAAYAGLPYRTRRTLHRLAGLRMERDYAATLDEMGGLLSLHFHRAGDAERTWRYARQAAARARESSAFAAAADLFRRALDAARTLELPASEVASAWEALGEMQGRAGEVRKAVAAFSRARRLVSDDPVERARLMNRTAWVYERVGRTELAARWCRRGLRALEGVDGDPARSERTWLKMMLASTLRQRGRPRDAARLFAEATETARALGDELQLARAAFNLDRARSDLGQLKDLSNSELALEIYTRAGLAERQAAVLNNFGIYAYFAGRWVEAYDFYTRAAEANRRAGDSWAGAYDDCNIGELLADQGHLEQAEERLRAARRVWVGTEDDHGVAFVSALLGRLAARAGRHDEAAELLARAVEDFGALQAPGDEALATAYLAEAALLAGDAAAALERAEALLSNVAAPRPLALRVRGSALSLLGREEQAATVLEEALAAARDDEDFYEIAVTLDALVRLGLADDDGREERDRHLAAMGIVALPAPLVPAARIAEA